MINPRIVDVLCTARAALDAAIVAHTAPRSTDRLASIIYVGVSPTDGRRLYTMPHDLSASALHAWDSAEFAAQAKAFGGYSDWQVPTKDELELLYRAKDEIGGFQPVWYWSSTSYDRHLAWRKDFCFGSGVVSNKGILSRVRCVRTS